MYSVLIAIKNFDKRFPQATQYLQEHNIDIIIRDSIASLTAEDSRKILPFIDALIPAAEPCDAKLLEQAKNLRILSRMGSGMDNIDLDYCKARGIIVTNSKGCNANGVAEMAMALIFASLRSIVRLNNYAREGAWFKRFPGEELWGKTIGLVGFGIIARRLAEMLQPFSTSIIACDPLMDHDAAVSLHVTPVSFDELLLRSDIVSVHVPALKENIDMFNAETFSAMKNGAVFINCARGILVNEDDLYNALKSGKLYAAASDVFRTEPVQPYNKLFELHNFIGTPHVAGMTTKSAVDDSMAVATSIVDCLNGLEPGYRIV